MSKIGHGGKEIVERLISSRAEARKRIEGLPQVAVTGRVARECIGIAYGFFTPLKRFMGKPDVDSVCENMALSDGTLWPIPIVLDVDNEEIKKNSLKEKNTILLTYSKKPLAIVEIEEIYTYDKVRMQQAVFGTTDKKHPGVRLFSELKNTFVSGKITLVNLPKFRPPFDKFWYTPKCLRQIISKKGWKRVVAHQTRNVPHGGHEWLMKGTWFSTQGEMPVEKLQTGILVSCIIGPKRVGDYIDEAILLGQQKLNEAKYFRDDIHMVSFVLWDMLYAGPREAILHAIIRENLGCTHHMFGRDHAGVGCYYGPYDAHQVFDQIPKDSLNIKPIRVLEWWYCPICGEISYSGLCGHNKEKQPFSGSMIRSIIQDKVKPTKLIFRPEVFDTVMESAKEYGFGSPFCTEEYLVKRKPVFVLEDL